MKIVLNTSLAMNRPSRGKNKLHHDIPSPKITTNEGAEKLFFLVGPDLDLLLFCT